MSFVPLTAPPPRVKYTPLCRYVGDILAWVHQAVAMEKELAAALFGTPLAEGEAAGDAGESDAGGEDGQSAEGLMSSEEVLCKVLQGIARPLQVGQGALRVKIAYGCARRRCHAVMESLR